jgi:DNA-binding transcriptional LysR family regulator
MTLQQLQQVITIAESRSMNEAAKKLFVSQPNLSAVVKELEEEAGIAIFIRSNRGIVVTPEGEEFLGYAKQVVEQYRLLEHRYMDARSRKIFSVSMQHYSFAVKAFVEMVKSVGMEEYEFAVHETQTSQVIENVRNMKSELGVLYLSSFNEAVLQKLFKEYDLVFEELFACDTYVYMWSKHPLAEKSVITMTELEPYPCLMFEQGKNNSFYFAEEMMSTYDYRRVIRADDRATMLNLMVGLGGYTLCSGIICEELNGDDYIAVPLAETEKMRIGIIRHKGVKISRLGEIYLSELRKYGENSTYGL